MTALPSTPSCPDGRACSGTRPGSGRWPRSSPRTSTSCSSSRRSTRTSTCAGSSATSRSPGRAGRSRWSSSRRPTSARTSRPTLARVAVVAVGVDDHRRSAPIDGRGIDELRAHIAPGATVAFVGSSGVGKSTLVNTLAGERGGRRPRDPRGRRPRPPHDEPPPAPPDAGRRAGAGHAGNARARPVGCRCRPRALVRRHRRTRRDVPVLGLPPRRRARLRRCRARSPTAISTAAGSRAGRSSSARLDTSSGASTTSPARPSDGAGRTISKSVGKHMEAKYGREGW